MNPSRANTMSRLEFSRLDWLVEKRVMILFAVILTIAALAKYLVLSAYDGGGELQSSYIPKTLMFLQGQNPYSTQLWSAPYPPLMFIVLGAIIKIGTIGTVAPLSKLPLITWDLRFAGLIADLLVGFVAFVGLRFRGFTGLRSLVPSGVYLLSPGLSLSSYWWFHGDIFGLLILACSLLALVKNRILLGVSLLSVAVAFKLQPILSLLLILVWVARKPSAHRISSTLSATGILGAGLVLPLMIPGYSDAVVGFNLAYGGGQATASFTLMNLLNGLLPSLLGTSFSPFQVNLVWIMTTAAFFTVALGVVWIRGDVLGPVRVVALGLLVWLIPLRTLYPYYLMWGFIPFLFIGNYKHVLGLAVVFEGLNKLANFSWNVQPNPFPQLDSATGYVITSLAFLAWGVLGMIFLFRSIRNRSLKLIPALPRL